MMLCNPQNPTGNCWTEEDLLRIGELCLKNNVVVLADEIHCDFETKGRKYVPFASLPDKDIVNNSLTFKAVSKTFSLAAMDMESPEHYVEKWFVENAHVQLNPGSNYGTGGAGHMRMNLGTPRPFIEKALNNMAAALKKV